MQHLGTVNATYDELVGLFGPPTSKGDNYKTEAQWDVDLTRGHPVSIYNYKNSRSYDSKKPLIHKVTEWSVQAKDSGAIDWLRGMIGVARKDAAAPDAAEAAEERKEKHIEFIKCYLNLWDAADNEHIAELTELFKAFCAQNNYPHISADELLLELISA